MASDEIKLEEIVLAAWLHDVGKFAQRADVPELYDKGLEGQYCKTTKDGRYTHQHVIYTEGFLSKRGYNCGRYTHDLLKDLNNVDDLKEFDLSNYNLKIFSLLITKNLLSHHYNKLNNQYS